MLKLKWSLVVSAAAVTLADAPLAAAYDGPCETDVFGRCTYAPIAMASAEDAPENLSAYGETPDQHFAYWLTHDDDVPNFRITDFDLLKAQALQGCELTRGGSTTLDAVQSLERTAGYSFDLASIVILAGNMVYCR